MDKIKNIQIIDSELNVKTIPAAISQIYYNEKGNLNITTEAEDLVNGKGAKINIESYSDIQIKPGDDISLISSHRAEDKQNEISVKVLDGDDKPVELQINTSGITLSTKDKTGDKSNVLDIDVKATKTKKGYLKVKALAIDLRCEEHGGIALQPKGSDSEGHENKIKFEHDGGDGLEFGTFNTKHTSIFTEDYRFNENGRVYAVTRQTPVLNLETGKTDYPTQADDFKDVINESNSATWLSIIDAANACSHEVLDEDGTVGYSPTIHVDRSNDLNITTSINQQDININADGNVNIESSANEVNITSKDITIDAKQNLTIQCNNKVDISANDDLCISCPSQSFVNISNIVLPLDASDNHGNMYLPMDCVIYVYDQGPETARESFKASDLLKMVKYFKTNNSEIFA